MRLLNAVCVLLLISLMNSCRKQDPPPPQVTVTVTCACDEFPFPEACSSKCETGQVQIESVNAKDRTVMIVIRHGALSESQTIPLDRLPAGVAAERGASFTALLKKEVTTASAATSPAAASGPGSSVTLASKIVRFTKRP